MRAKKKETKDNQVVTYLEYELSPRPNVVKLTLPRQLAGSRFLRRLFQNFRAFLGISPWPVVEITNMTRGQ